MDNLAFAFTAIGIVFAICMPCIGSAIGLSLVGQATSGLLTEDPKRFGKSLILQLLPGSQGIYGLVVSFMILGAFGSGVNNISMAKGLTFCASGVIMGFGGLWSAIYQGKCIVASVGLFAKREDQFTKSLLIGAMVEFYAILPLLISVMLLMNV